MRFKVYSTYDMVINNYEPCNHSKLYMRTVTINEMEGYLCSLSEVDKNRNIFVKYILSFSVIE